MIKHIITISNTEESEEECKSVDFGKNTTTRRSVNSFHETPINKSSPSTALYATQIVRISHRPNICVLLFSYKRGPRLESTKVITRESRT